MSNFDPQELKPDSSDRPNTNRPKRNGPSHIDNIKTRLASLNISRQHLMMAIGILVLLIIILTIFSALKGSDDAKPTQLQPQNIVLPSQQNTTTENNTVPNDPFANLPAPSNTSEQPAVTPPPVQPTQPPEIIMSPDNTAANTASPETTSQPTSQQQTHNTTPAQQPSANTVTPAKPDAPKAQPQTPTTKQTSVASLPASYVTLQLSSASQPKTLEAFAKKQNLEQYWIYETRRDSKPWFVLIHGAYPNVQQANQAISTLPADVQAKKPWVKPIRQVQQEAKQR